MIKFAHVDKYYSVIFPRTAKIQVLNATTCLLPILAQFPVVWLFSTSIGELHAAEISPSNLPDRIEIQKRFPDMNQTAIARASGVSKSAISRELCAHSLDGRYDAVRAQRLADLKAAQKTFRVPCFDPLLLSFITEKFSADWSPEQIAGFLRTQQSDLPAVSHETIYQMLYRGFVRHEPRCRKKKIRKYRRRRLPKPPINIDRKSILQRPATPVSTQGNRFQMLESKSTGRLGRSVEHTP